MSKSKTMWYEVKTDETIEECLKRLTDDGYTVAARKEEPLFEEVNGEFLPIKQVIKFKGILTEE